MINTFILEFKNKETHSIDFLERLTTESNCVMIEKRWRSSINKNVVYDHAPFCSDNFNIEVSIQGSQEALDYIEYCLKKELDTKKHLNKCLELSM